MTGDSESAPDGAATDVPAPDVAALVAELKQRVADRRRAGVYPPGLEDELEQHFRHIAAHRVIPDLDDVRRTVAHVENKAQFSAERIAAASGVPGGEVIHKTMAKLQLRQTQGILAQVQEFAEATQDALRAILAALEQPATHVHPDLVGHIEAVYDRLTSYERSSAGGVTLANVRARVEELEAIERRRQFRPWFSNDHFEAAFRGSAEEITARYIDLAARFKGVEGSVVDIGCGRGEFLELLEREGVRAFGIEIDGDLADAARAKGLDVEHGDGLELLASMDDRSLGGMALIQVVEHLTAQQLVDLVATSADKLEVGGRVVIETVNPQSLYVYAHSFYLDPTHVSPVHPAYLRFLFEEAGFRSVETDWRSPVPADDALEPVEGADGEPAATRGNANVRRLNQLIFAPQDYAIIATR